MRKAPTLLFVVVVMLSVGSGRQSAQRGQPNLERQYTEIVRPFTAKYCIGCADEARGGRNAAGFVFRAAERGATPATLDSYWPGA